MSDAHPLVTDYLRRLERAAADLPPDRRDELLDGIGEHIASAGAQDEAGVRALLDRLGEPEVIVAAAREDLPGSAGWQPPVAHVPRGTGHELGAVLMLTLGSFLPVVGWLVGVVLLWTSSLWRVREKVLGTLVVPLGPGGALLAGAFLPVLGGRQTCTSSTVHSRSRELGGGALPPPPVDVPPPPPVDVPPAPSVGQGSVEISGTTCTVEALGGWTTGVLVAVLLLAPVVVAVLLMRTARRRAGEQPVAVHGSPQPASPWGGVELAGVLVLGLGGLLVPVLGPLVGLALVLSSSRWTRPERLVAAGLCLLPLLAPLGSLVLPGTLLPGLGGGELLLLGLLLLGPMLAAVYLALVLQRRR